jgi:hypothetical protein
MSNKRRSRNSTEARNALIDYLGLAEIAQMPSESLDALTCVKLRERFNLSQREWSFLWGYESAIRERWYRAHLAYCVVWNGETLRMDWNTLPEDCKDFLRACDKAAVTGHFWLNKDGSIGRPYSHSVSHVGKGPVVSVVNPTK